MQLEDWRILIKTVEGSASKEDLVSRLAFGVRLPEDIFAIRSPMLEVMDSRWQCLRTKRGESPIYIPIQSGGC